MHRLPPALAAAATPRILELLGDGPGRVLELGFAGIHAHLLELSGWTVEVVESDPRQAARAHERGAQVVKHADGRFDVVIAQSGTDLTDIDAARILLVAPDGSVKAVR